MEHGILAESSRVEMSGMQMEVSEHLDLPAVITQIDRWIDR